MDLTQYALSFPRSLLAVLSDPEGAVRAQTWTTEQWARHLRSSILLLYYRLKKYTSSYDFEFPSRSARGRHQDVLLHQPPRGGPRTGLVNSPTTSTTARSAFWGGRSGATNTIRSRSCLSAACLCSICLVPRFSQSCFVHYVCEPAKFSRTILLSHPDRLSC